MTIVRTDDRDYLDQRDELLGGIFIAADSLGWDTAELSRRSGVSLATIDKYKQGQIPSPRLDTLYWLADAVGLWLSFTNTGA